MRLRVKPICPGLLCLALVLVACSRPERLTREDAESLVRSTFVESEPVYAEVPMEVSWSPDAPRDGFDDLSIRTLESLASAGLISIQRSGDQQRGLVRAFLTPEGQRILGLVPSARGQAIRGRIAVKALDGVGRVELHPSDPTTGRVEVLWRYTSPTPLYEMFLTRVDKPLDEPFASVVSVGWSEGAWRGRVIVRKTRPSSLAG